MTDRRLILVPWFPGSLVSWCPGVLVSWFPGVLVSWFPGVGFSVTKLYSFIVNYWLITVGLPVESEPRFRKIFTRQKGNETMFKATLIYAAVTALAGYGALSSALASMGL